ncbi:hypothetical protein PQR62_09725 [Herbaspirillum lusitanum]|uniref:Uncharacterized protein n=1 Tax=Herbaspirillum lusitanum TaxID=213312 RepID=A0ABW9A9L3_9BURK
MPPTAPSSAAAATAVTPIFSQLLAVGMPAGFVLINENASERRYLREAVLRGENEETWTQMLSVTGTRDLAQKPDATPERFAETISENFQRACPESFNQKTLAADDSNGYQRYIAVMSCGTAGAAATPISETALIMVVKGRRDYYTVQWAERGAASKDALSIDTRKWVQRYRLLMPVRVCDRVADEAPPYPSCLKQ